jgi:hypothetical protein
VQQQKLKSVASHPPHLPPLKSLAHTHLMKMYLQAVAASLSSHMLLSLEVAVEYWLALSWSPQAQWLSGSGASSVLQHEVTANTYCPH